MIGFVISPFLAVLLRLLVHIYIHNGIFITACCLSARSCQIFAMQTSITSEPWPWAENWLDQQKNENETDHDQVCCSIGISCLYGWHLRPEIEDPITTATNQHGHAKGQYHSAQLVIPWNLGYPHGALNQQTKPCSKTCALSTRAIDSSENGKKKWCLIMRAREREIYIYVSI